MLFKFPAKIVERHYSSKLPCVYFEFPAQIITVIILLYQLLLERQPAVERLFIWIARCNYNRHYYSKFVNVSCFSSVFQLSVERLSFIFCGWVSSKNSLLFPFQFFQFVKHVWKHVWKSHWRLSPCRRLFQAESWVVSFKLMLILWSIDRPSILSY